MLALANCYSIKRNTTPCPAVINDFLPPHCQSVFYVRLKMLIMWSIHLDIFHYLSFTKCCTCKMSHSDLSETRATLDARWLSGGSGTGCSHSFSSLSLTFTMKHPSWQTPLTWQKGHFQPIHASTESLAIWLARDHFTARCRKGPNRQRSIHVVFNGSDAVLTDGSGRRSYSFFSNHQFGLSVPLKPILPLDLL